jgi:hypothetical protein
MGSFFSDFLDAVNPIKQISTLVNDVSNLVEHPTLTNLINTGVDVGDPTHGGVRNAADPKKPADPTAPAELPPPPSPNDPSVQAQLNAQAAAQRLVQGRNATIFTSPQGLLSSTKSLTHQTLLGS